MSSSAQTNDQRSQSMAPIPTLRPRSNKLSRIRAQIFGLRWLAEYMARFSTRVLLRKRFRRTPAAVLEEYEEDRRAYLNDFRGAALSLDEYLCSDADAAAGNRYLQVIDGELHSGALSKATEYIQRRVVAALDSYKPRAVIEFGCGTGRNLLAFKRLRPEVRCIGLELTHSSVELARLASRRYGLDLEIHEADVTEPLFPLGSVDVCFSVHTLEQIPNSRAVLDQMYRLSRLAVVLFEPITEMYGWTPREIAARIRARHLDRLRGLCQYARRKQYTIGRCRLLDVAVNALNPTVELHILSERLATSQEALEQGSVSAN